MSIQRHSNLTKLLLIPLILLLFCTACSPPSNSGDKIFDLNDPDQNISPVGNQAGVYTAQGLQVPESMGFVFDPQGNPLSNAVLQSGESSDLNGLLISYGKTYTEEWAVIQKSGFLTGFAQAKESLPDAYVFQARLTPLSAVMQLETEEPQSMGIGDLRDPDLELLFPASAFSSIPIIAGVAEINPVDIGPLFESLDTGQELSPQRAFGLQARQEHGEESPLTSGKMLEISIRDNGELAEPIIMAAFDPGQGVWQVLPKPCSRRDPTHISCEVDRISPLIGLFTAQEPLWMPALADLQSRTPSQAGLMAPILNPPANMLQQSGGCDGPIGEALDQELQSYQVIIDEMVAGGADPDSITMIDVMNGYARAASAYANLCKNEKGKAALLKVTSAGLLLGLESGEKSGWDPTVVADKISELTVDRAKEELAEGKCLDMKEAMGALQEALLLGDGNTQLPGGKETIKEAFDRKIEEWSEECDLWEGTIEIMHFPERSHFGLEDWTVLNSSSTWTETHDIRLSTHPDTHAITGRSQITLNFPMILYAKVESEDPCDVHSFQSYYGFPSEQMTLNGEQGDLENPAAPEGQLDPEIQELFEQYKENPESLSPENLITLGELLTSLTDPDASQETTSGDNGSTDPGELEYGLDITFGGTYNGSVFNISDLEYNAYAEILQYIYNEGEEDDKCVTEFEASIPVHNYSSFLAHGFYGSPPITLQEIFETPPGNAGGIEVIRGSEKYSNPSTDIGSYPFNSSTVIWNLYHVQDQGIN